MINHFRSTLMNYVAADISDIYTPYFISPSYIDNHIVLPTRLANFYNVIFPDTSKAALAKQANVYTMLVASVGLNDAFVMYDNRITYKLEELQEFTETVVDLVDLSTMLIDTSVSNDLINYGDNHDKYLEYYRSARNDMQRLAGIICCYSYKVGKLQLVAA